MASRFKMSRSDYRMGDSSESFIVIDFVWAFKSSINWLLTLTAQRCTLCKLSERRLATWCIISFCSYSNPRSGQNLGGLHRTKRIKAVMKVQYSKFEVSWWLLWNCDWSQNNQIKAYQRIVMEVHSRRSAKNKMMWPLAITYQDRMQIFWMNIKYWNKIFDLQSTPSNCS